MNTRNWSIRSKIIALVTAPLAALLALWIFATVLAAGPALNLLSVRTVLDAVGRPGDVLVAELQRERRLAVVYLSGGDGEPRPQRAATDRAVAEFRAAATGDDAQRAAGELLRFRLRQLSTALDGLAVSRGYIDRREVDPAGAHNLYSSFIDGLFLALSATATYDEPQIDRELRALTGMGRGREWLSRTDSLLAGVHASGSFTGDDHARLIETIGTQKFIYAEAAAELPTSDRIVYQRLIGGPAFVQLAAMQDTLVRSSRAGAAAPVTREAWRAAYDPVVQQLRAFELNATDSLAARAAPVATGILMRLALAGLLGIAAVAVTAFVSVRVGRSLIGRLRLLHTALDEAGEQLPALIARLRRGETVDTDAEPPTPDFGTDEVGRLGRAFAAVRRTAVQSAIDEAGIRRGLNEVFLNIARRSQTLLHRQLALLDELERRETEPQTLENLYRIDHLATRMRRHAEDLVILAGAKPGRGWRQPVPMIDVVRGAISEVEDYTRIDVRSMDVSSLRGPAVADVIHLLAELLENATAFSPPHTRVQVAGQRVPNGYAVEVEDRGLGLSNDALADANLRLLSPPDFDPADSARLGLFVVARLAGRHGIRVQLRASPYGGVTAVALVPSESIVEGAGPVALPAGPSAPDRCWEPAVAARPVAVRADVTVPAAPTRGADPAAPTLGEEGLPRRVRQANLAPHLRQAAAEPDGAPAMRSPEEARRLMSALQSGTARGRQAATAPPPVADSAPVADLPPAVDLPPAAVAGSPPRDVGLPSGPAGEPAPMSGPGWADAVTAGYPVTVARAMAPSESPVHHGVVVPRQAPGRRPPADAPDDPPIPWHTTPVRGGHASGAHDE